MCGFWPRHIEEVVAAGLDLQHYVFCGSTAVYGQIGKTTPNEGTPPKPKSDYELGKTACAEYLLSLHGDGQLPMTVLRLAHPYGPRDELLYSTGRESLFLDRMRHGRPIMIPGEGDTRIHPIYVEDAARAFVYALCRADCMGRILNLSGDEILSADEYFASIARALDRPLVAHHVPTEWLEANSHLWADADRKFNFGPVWCRYESAFDVTALKGVGFRCLTGHDEGVALNVAWLDEHGMIPSSSDDDLEDVVIRQSGVGG